MAVRKRENGKTPNGGDYSEITFFNDAGEMVDEKIATNFILNECKKDGAIVGTIYGRI